MLLTLQKTAENSICRAPDSGQNSTNPAPQLAFTNLPDHFPKCFLFFHVNHSYSNVYISGFEFFRPKVAQKCPDLDLSDHFCRKKTRIWISESKSAAKFCRFGFKRQKDGQNSAFWQKRRKSRENFSPKSKSAKFPATFGLQNPKMENFGARKVAEIQIRKI